MILRDPTNVARADDPPVTENTHVVCIGLSAGGLHPLRRIFERLNPNTGMTFVVVPHLSRAHPTLLPELLAEWSGMPSCLIRDGLALEPNHVYTIPPGEEITVNDGCFRVRPRSKHYGWSNVITLFLESLIEFRRPPGIAVILSGYDADGAAALAAFRKLGGVTIAQDLASAYVKDMPKSAIATGVVDYVLTPDAIAGKIEAIAKNYDHHEDEACNGAKQG
jgi:two-component system, chemotaxis family, protein-glutamate methylesterase/glutaminase